MKRIVGAGLFFFFLITGTSLAENFLPFFEQVFEKKRRKFPFDVSEIRHASDPLNAVARGLLIQAMQEYED